MWPSRQAARQLFGLNQGARNFVRIPSTNEWKNVLFVGLQDESTYNAEAKAMDWTNGCRKKWNGYTLVVSYDNQFEHDQATLQLGGAHPLGVKRETGFLALTGAANLKLNPKYAQTQLNRIAHLSEADRGLVNSSTRCRRRRRATRGTAVVPADRTQISTQITPNLTTTATYMLKNNGKQHLLFTCPKALPMWPPAQRHLREAPEIEQLRLCSIGSRHAREDQLLSKN